MIEFPFPDVDDWMLLKQLEDEYEKHGVIKISCDEKIYYQIPYWETWSKQSDLMNIYTFVMYSWTHRNKLI